MPCSLLLPSSWQLAALTFRSHARNQLHFALQFQLFIYLVSALAIIIRRVVCTSVRVYSPPLSLWCVARLYFVYLADIYQ